MFSVMFRAGHVKKESPALEDGSCSAPLADEDQPSPEAQRNPEDHNRVDLMRLSF